MLFDFIIRKVIDETGVSGVQFSYASHDFYQHLENYEKFNILNLLYADELVAMWETANDLEMFVKAFEKMTQDYGLTMNIKKMCIISLQLFEDDHNRIIIIKKWK